MVITKKTPVKFVLNNTTYLIFKKYGVMDSLDYNITLQQLAQDRNIELYDFIADLNDVIKHHHSKGS